MSRQPEEHSFYGAPNDLSGDYAAMLLRHSVIYLFGRGLPGLVNFATIAVYTRLLPPELYGQYALVLAGVTLANAILFQWLRLGVLRFLPAHTEHPTPLLATVLTGYLAMAGMALGLGGLGLLLAPDATWGSLILLGVLLLWARAWFGINQAILRSQLAPARFGILSFTKSALALTGGTSLILLGLGAAGPLLGLALAALVSCLALARAPWRGIGWPRPVPGLTRSLLVYGLPLTPALALSFVVSTSDRFLVTWFLGTDAAGTYAAAYDLAWPAISSLMVIVNLAGYSLVMRAMEGGGQAAAQVQLRNNGLLLLLVALPALILVIMVAPNIARVVLGAPFRAEGAPLLPWIGLAAFFGGATLFYTNLAFQLSGKTAGLIWVSLASALLNLALNWLWIPRFGLLGAAWATLLAYGLGLGLSWWLGRPVFPLPSLPVDALKPIAAALVMAVALWPCRDWLGPIALAGQVGLGLGVYGIALSLLDLIFGRSHLLRLLRRTGIRKLGARS